MLGLVMHKYACGLRGAMELCGFELDLVVQPKTEPGVPAKGINQIPKLLAPQKRKRKEPGATEKIIRVFRRERMATETEVEEQHVKECKDKDCPQCKCMRNRHKWSERMPCIQEDMGIKMVDIPATQAAVCRGPWLHISAGDRFGLTCVTCKCAIPADT